MGEDLTLPVVKPKKTTPCEELKKVSNSPNYNENINFLKQKAIGSKEHAWVYKYFENSTNFAPPTVAGHNTENSNTVNLDAYKDNIWIGAFHNHTQGNNPTVKMFSPKDMEWLLRKALKKNSYQPPSASSQGITELFLGLVNENETYCLKIKDWNKFYTLKDEFDGFERELVKLQKGRGNNASQIVLQKDFLKMLDEFDLGIGLYEQDTNGDWSEINLDPINPNNTPIKTPCN